MRGRPVFLSWECVLSLVPRREGRALFGATGKRGASAKVTSSSPWGMHGSADRG